MKSKRVKHMEHQILDQVCVGVFDFGGKGSLTNQSCWYATMLSIFVNFSKWWASLNQ